MGEKLVQIGGRKFAIAVMFMAYSLLVFVGCVVILTVAFDNPPAEVISSMAMFMGAAIGAPFPSVASIIWGNAKEHQAQVIK